MMIKLTVTLCTVVMLGSAGSVLAKQEDKASICHNGSTYNSDTQMEEPISFVITIAGKRIAKAVDKHVANHADLETYEVGAEGAGKECKVLEDSTIACEAVTLCEPSEPS